MSAKHARQSQYVRFNPCFNGSCSRIYFRADCQNTQQYITEKYLVAGRDSGMSQEDRRLNAEYRDFLVEASSIIDVYLARSNPDFTEYEKYRDNLLK